MPSGGKSEREREREKNRETKNTHRYKDLPDSCLRQIILYIQQDGEVIRSLCPQQEHHAPDHCAKRQIF
jgi:hypothetical protein